MPVRSPALSRLRNLPRAMLCALPLLFGVRAAEAGDVVKLPAEVTADASWSGEILVDHPVAIRGQATVAVEPGTRIFFGPEGSVSVEGRLTARGTAENPIRIEGGEKKQGECFRVGGVTASLAFERVDARSLPIAISAQGSTVRLVHSSFRGGKLGLQLDVDAKARIEDSLFEENEVGVVADTRAALTAERVAFRRGGTGATLETGSRGSLTECTFEGNQQAIFAQRASAYTIARCAFRKNQTGILLQRTDKGPVISFCTFAENQKGIVARTLSHPLVEGSEFSENETGFEVYEFSAPLVRYSRFSKNATAVSIVKKSNATLAANLFERNTVALFANFCSYPAATGNLFRENDWHVRLERQQSMDFERRLGSRNLSRGTASARTDRPAQVGRDPAPMRPGAPGLDEQVFSVAGNSWDEETEAQMRAGKNANVKGFWDGRDQPTVTYEKEGYDATPYALDVIEFLPFADRTASSVGPAAWKPYRQEAAASPPAAGSPPPESPDKAQRP